MSVADEARTEARKAYRDDPDSDDDFLGDAFEKGWDAHGEWQASHPITDEQADAVATMVGFADQVATLTAQLQAAQAVIAEAIAVADEDGYLPVALAGVHDDGMRQAARHAVATRFRAILSRADTSAFDAAIRAAKAEVLRAVRDELRQRAETLSSQTAMRRVADAYEAANIVGAHIASIEQTGAE